MSNFAKSDKHVLHCLFPSQTQPLQTSDKNKKLSALSITDHNHKSLQVQFYPFRGDLNNRNTIVHVNNKKTPHHHMKPKASTISSTNVFLNGGQALVVVGRLFFHENHTGSYRHGKMHLLEIVLLWFAASLTHLHFCFIGVLAPLLKASSQLQTHIHLSTWS